VAGSLKGSAWNFAVKRVLVASSPVPVEPTRAMDGRS
jgi:hypothetical protein